MKKWFWPCLTWTACLTALALWFGADRVETDIAEQTAKALEPYVWTGFDVDGRDVVLKGMAPDPDMQRAAHAALEHVWAIRDITDLTTVLQLASPYRFKIGRNAQELALSGFIPNNESRDQVVAAAGEVAPDISIDDEMAVARGNQPEFMERVLFAINLAKKLPEAEIEIVDEKLSIRGTVSDEAIYDEIEALKAAQLPYGLKLAVLDVKKSVQ
ncbi:hypothetical protein [Brucella sp. 2280]|uniref:hypothetical protein n=1 Tax=Brucella sp. 2280 TaxID=2592625 RepID=UPI0012977E04|nr:hypothetical protein [Brucella sp. 2280]QGA57583.1 hypothetical protein GHC20_11100 [Brucella sp. 2280]